MYVKNWTFTYLIVMQQYDYYIYIQAHFIDKTSYIDYFTSYK